MDRYRSYGQSDDQPKQVGDGAFIGVDEYNAPENIREGNVQKAVNHDFSSQDANTRGGFVCLPELGAESFGSKWQLAPSVPPGTTWAIAYGNAKFVAIGYEYPFGSVDGQSRYSSDGKTWSSVVFAAGTNLLGLGFGNGRFVAAGDNFVYSDDGINWTASVSTPPITAGRFRQVVYGNGRFVATAPYTGGLSVQGDLVAVSTDNGVTWSFYQQPAGIAFGFLSSSVTYANGRFVGAVGVQGVASSPDGITWSSQIVGSASYGWTTVAYGNGKFVIAGPGILALSDDFATWTINANTGDTYSQIKYLGGVFVAYSAGGGPTVLGTSVDGTKFIRSQSATDVFPTYGIRSIATDGNGRFVIAQDDQGTNPAYSDNVSSIIFGSGLFSDPFEPDTPWIVLVANDKVGFFAFGKASKTVSLGAYRVTTQSTIVQANNYLYLFRGDEQTPLRWNGQWDSDFELVPDTSLPTTYGSIPKSSQATYYQNRLWVQSGKDNVAASDVLAFTDYDPVANEFSINTGNSDYVVATFPFGTNTLVVFKNKSILALNNVEGSLLDVTTTEVTRQVGLIGINAVTSIGPDLAYVSYGNINLLTLTATNNSLQHKILPLSARIQKIMDRVNWEVGYKISLGYWNNKLYVALPLDNSTVCNAVAVYNFVTENWYGEWNFASAIGMNIQSWQVSTYLGLQRLFSITDDGRIFVTDEGQNDISGTTVAEISTELITRAYDTDNLNHFQRRIYLDLATNRPRFSAAAFTEGATEESTLLTDQTYSRSETWKFADSTYDLTNANNDYNRAYRKDYSTGPLAAGTTPGQPSTGLQPGTGFEPEMAQEFRLPLLTSRQGRLSWIKVTNTQGFISVMSLGYETRPGQRANLVQI